MDYHIRKAGQSDINELITLSTKVTDFNNRQYLPEKMIDEFFSSGALEQEILDNLENMTLLTDGNKIIGLISFTANLMEMLMISPEFQGKGAGYFLMKTVCDEVFRDFNTIAVEVFSTNTHARKFYQRFGFTEYAEEEIPGLVVKIARYRMKRDNIHI